MNANKIKTNLSINLSFDLHLFSLFFLWPKLKKLK